MDFKDTPEEAEFRAQVKAWLAKNAPKFAQSGANVRREEDDSPENIKVAKEWQALKAEAGYAFIQWPQEYGGRGSAMQSVIYTQEEAKFPVPRNYFIIGAFAGPTLMAWATEEQKARYLPPMLRGEEVWCQLFSEPGAGSDLAGIRTRCELEGDTWVVNGQKVWTTVAYMADWAIMVARHDPTLPKHMGLTYFFFDMKSPGVEVTRIKQVSGGSDFCEVFLNDVRIPDSQRLGRMGDGWSVCLTTLMNERFNAGDAYRPDANELLGLAQRLNIGGKPAIENSAIRERIAEWHIQSAGAKFTKFRTLTALSRGQTPGPEASILKLVNASKLQDIGAYGMDQLGMAGILADADDDDAQFLLAYLAAPGARIAGGTDEILRNIIAERVLALPGDIRVDKELPFNKLASGTK